MNDNMDFEDVRIKEILTIKIKMSDTQFFISISDRLNYFIFNSRSMKSYKQEEDKIGRYYGINK